MKELLLVDDERWVRTALKWTINKLQLPLQVIHECENGLEALDWIKHNECGFSINRYSDADHGWTFVCERT